MLSSFMGWYSGSGLLVAVIGCTAEHSEAWCSSSASPSSCSWRCAPTGSTCRRRSPRPRRPRPRSGRNRLRADPRDLDPDAGASGRQPHGEEYGSLSPPRSASSPAACSAQQKTSNRVDARVGPPPRVMDRRPPRLAAGPVFRGLTYIGSWGAVWLLMRVASPRRWQVLLWVRELCGPPLDRRAEGVDPSTPPAASPHARREAAHLDFRSRNDELRLRRRPRLIRPETPRPFSTSSPP